MSTTKKPDRRLRKIIEIAYLQQHTHFIGHVAEWAMAIETYIATHKPSPGCPETNWRKSIETNEVRKSRSSLHGSKLSYDLIALLKKALEARGLRDVKIDTEVILFR
jgi:hypothetical protein